MTKPKKKPPAHKASEAEKKSPVIFKESRDDCFKENYVTGAIGGINFGAFVMNFYADHPLPEESTKKKGEVVIERHFKTRLIMSPGTAKSVADWIYRHLKSGDEDPKQGLKAVMPSEALLAASSQKEKKQEPHSSMYG